MKITRINHAAVNIHGKVDEAREFYTELLGLPEIADPAARPAAASRRAACRRSGSSWAASRCTRSARR